jgi:O-acetylserine/cysteine efflux transporter
MSERLIGVSNGPGPLPLGHALLAVLVTAVWGTNFVVIRIGLADFPPIFFALMRFTLVAFPAILFIRRPQVRWRHLLAYGAIVGGGQFGLLYLAMRGYISAGLASLVIQSQVFFTIGLSMWLAKERLKPYQGAAVTLASAGLLVIAAYGSGDATAIGLALVLAAGFAWAVGNMLLKRSPNANMLGYVVWSSPFALPPLLLLSLTSEGPRRIQEAFVNADLNAWLALLWQSTGNTLFGFAAWGWLLSRHPAATIAPTGLLVPIFGLAATAIWLGEPMQSWKTTAAALVLTGLAVNILYPWFVARHDRRVAVPPAV